MSNDSNLIKTEFNDDTREYFTHYFLEKPCTPSVMDYLLYNMFDKPFSMASSSYEFDERNDILSISEREAFIIRIAKKYLHHYHFLSREDDPVKGMIEAWVHNETQENQEHEYPIRNAHDLFDISDDENVYTVIFWMKKGGIMEYGYTEESFDKDKDDNEENEKHIVPIEQNMVMILPDYVYYKPYVTSPTSQQYIQYIMVHLCV